MLDNPYTILGTAASNSTTKDKTVPILPGTISLTKIAIPILIGTAIAIAIAELIGYR